MTRTRGTIYKRNGAWAIRVGYDDNGKRREYRRQGFATKREADLARANALVSLGRGRSIDASRQTVEAYLFSWFSIYSKSGKISRSQLRSVEAHLRAYLVPRIGQLPLRKLKPQVIAGLLSDLRDNGRIHANYKGASPSLSNKTVRNIAGTLTRALHDAVKWGYLPSNPCDDVDLPRKDRPELVTWNGQQIAQFLQTAYDQRGLLSVWVTYWFMVFMLLEEPYLLPRIRLELSNLVGVGVGGDDISFRSR